MKSGFSGPINRDAVGRGKIAQIDMALSAGTHLGPYEILSRLGAGGMGEVYRARDTRLDRDVAIKVLPERLAREPQALARFQREAKAVAALSHPNILAIHDFGEENGLTYAVTELLEGETLRSRLRTGAMGWRKTLETGIAISDGLSAAHSNHVPPRSQSIKEILDWLDRYLGPVRMHAP